MVREVRCKAIEAIGDRGAGWATGFVVGAEHEMIDEQLRAPAEEPAETRPSIIRVERVILRDLHPRQLLPSKRKLVASPRMGLLGLEQLEPLLQPFLRPPERICRCNRRHLLFLSCGSPPQARPGWLPSRRRGQARLRPTGKAGTWL